VLATHIGLSLVEPSPATIIWAILYVGIKVISFILCPISYYTRLAFPQPKQLSQPWKGMNIPLTHDHASDEVFVDLSGFKGAGAMPPGQGFGGL